MSVTQTIVQLAQFALYAYGILEVRRVITHWIDAGPAVFPRRTADEAAIDHERRAGHGAFLTPSFTEQDRSLHDTSHDKAARF